MKVTIRKFALNDIPKKIEWINNSENNQYLHYDLPLEYEKTVEWFNRTKDLSTRFDAVIDVDDIPVGLIGLLSISDNSAEYYVSMGETAYKGKGIATQASNELLDYAFRTLKLENVYLFTEVDNIPAQALFSKIGFKMKTIRRKDILSHGKLVDRFEYVLKKSEWISKNELSHIEYVDSFYDNSIFIKREDLIPYSFGGNKARKAKLYFEEIDNGNYDCVVTYGTSHSNHCRVVANMAAQRKLPCIIISPEEVSEPTFNSKMITLFGAETIVVPVSSVHDSIEQCLASLREQGHIPYFIQGGGHGNIGTEAYTQCYDEIASFEEINNIHFDYIFFASGTGTTQAGLVCGKLIHNDDCKIIGISIARKNSRGRDVVVQSINDYFLEKGLKFSCEEIEENTIFVDDYISQGYGLSSEEQLFSIINELIIIGIPFDSTYTGKAYYGMKDYLFRHSIKEKTVLFIHTGGTPLFFDDLNSIIKDS